MDLDLGDDRGFLLALHEAGHLVAACLVEGIRTDDLVFVPGPLGAAVMGPPRDPRGVRAAILCSWAGEVAAQVVLGHLPRGRAPEAPERARLVQQLSTDPMGQLRILRGLREEAEALLRRPEVRNALLEVAAALHHGQLRGFAQVRQRVQRRLSRPWWIRWFSPS